MLKLAYFGQYEQDLVNGFYRLICNKYTPIDIVQLSINYLFILDKFDNTIKYENIEIKGVNNDLIENINEEIDFDTNKNEVVFLEQKIIK